MPWLLVDVAQGCVYLVVYLVAFVMVVVFFGAWIHWFMQPLLLRWKLAKKRRWRDEKMWRKFQKDWVVEYLKEEDLHKPV